MITRLQIQHFKGLDDYDIEFSRLNLLVGGNNSGKTTVFHALQTAFWCIERTAIEGSGTVTFRKTQVSQIPVVPYFDLRDLFFEQTTRTGPRPLRQRLVVHTD